MSYFLFLRRVRRHVAQGNAAGTMDGLVEGGKHPMSL